MRTFRWTGRAVTLGDQLLSSLSNVLAVVLVARVLSPGDFGRFALGYAVLTFALGLSRALLGTRISLALNHDSAREKTLDLVSAVVLISVPLVLVVFTASALSTGGEALGLLLLIAVATPVVCIQDLIRFGSAASGRPWVAFTSDLVWVLLMVWPFFLGTDLSPVTALALWASAATVAMIVALVMIGARLRLRAGLAELRIRDRVGESLTFGFVVVQGALLILLFVVAQAIGAAGAGTLRGASTAFGPVNVLLAFVSLGLTPALVRQRRGRDLRFCAATAGLTAALALLWGLLLLALPSSVGASAFGESWPAIRAILPWTLVEYVALCVAGAAILGLKVKGRAGQLVVQRAATGAVTVIGGSVLAVLTEEVWVVATALAASAITAAAIGWAQLALRQHATPSPQRPLVDPRPVQEV